MIAIHIPNNKTINFTIDEVTEKLTFTCYQALKLHLNILIQYITKEKIQNLKIVNEVDGTVRKFYSSDKTIAITNKQSTKKLVKVRYIPDQMITVQRSDKDIKEEKYLKLIRRYNRAIEKGNSINANKFAEEINKI